jgi:uncharacterized membrane protein
MNDHETQPPIPPPLAPIQPSAPNVSRALTIYSGPLPSPEVIEKYQRIYPDAAKTIFQTFAENNTANIEYRKLLLKEHYAERNRELNIKNKGVTCALVLSIIAFITLIIMGFLGYGNNVFYILTVPLLGIISGFLRWKHIPKTDPKDQP